MAIGAFTCDLRHIGPPKFRTKIGRDQRIIGIIVRCGQNRGIADKFQPILGRLGKDITAKRGNARRPRRPQFPVVRV